MPVPLTGSREARTCNRRAGKEGTGSAGACPPYPLHVAASTITASPRSRGGPLTVTLVINDTRLLTVISPLFGLTGNSYTNRLLTPGACALGIVSATNFGWPCATNCRSALWLTVARTGGSGRTEAGRTGCRQTMPDNEPLRGFYYIILMINSKFLNSCWGTLEWRERDVGEAQAGGHSKAQAAGGLWGCEVVRLREGLIMWRQREAIH